jgi:hypothetical protein
MPESVGTAFASGMERPLIKVKAADAAILENFIIG